jgi:hypothetical protein
MGIESFPFPRLPEEVGETDDFLQICWTGKSEVPYWVLWCESIFTVMRWKN